MLTEWLLVVLLVTSNKVTVIALDHRFENRAGCQTFIEQALPEALPKWVQVMPETITKTPVCVETKTEMV